MIIMAVDLGDARTGIAVSDAGESFAFPKEVISEKGQRALLTKLNLAAQKYSAEIIVVGLPLNMDGTRGYKAEQCGQTAQKLAAICAAEVVMWDERSTTVMAHKNLSELNVRGSKRKSSVDSEAAAILLESYLNYRKNQKGGNK